MAFAVAPDRSSVGYALTTDELNAVLSGSLAAPRVDRRLPALKVGVRLDDQA